MTMRAEMPAAATQALPARYSRVLDVQSDIWRWITRTDAGYRCVEGIVNLLASVNTEYSGDIRDNLRSGLMTQYRSMLIATPYYVSSDICALLSLGAQTIAPWRIAFDLFPTPSGFVLLETPHEFHYIEAGELITVYLRALAWDRCTTGDPNGTPRIKTHPIDAPLEDAEIPAVAITFFATVNPSPLATPQPTGIEVYRETTSAYDPKADVHDTDLNQGAAFNKFNYLGALLFFMRQRLLVSSEHEADRATRRRNKQGNSDPPPIQILRLRSKSYTREPRAEDSEQEREKIEHEYRWMVGHAKGGFWNTYHCGVGRTIEEQRWILPFIAGPPDKPLKMPDKILIEVNR